MRIPRFYINQPLQPDNELMLPKEIHRHAIQVLRLAVDDVLILFNGKGGEYRAILTNAQKRHSCVRIISFDAINRDSPLEISLAIAMIKADKMDFAIQKAVEMGVNCIQPLYTKRSVIKLKGNRLDKKIAHWQGVIKAACEQSGRTSIPQILVPIPLMLWLQSSTVSTSLHLVMLPKKHLHITTLKPPENEKMILIVGPEGGFTDQEVDLLLSFNKVEAIQCGPRILRAETAVIAGIAVCQQQWGDL
jgi:16S rRNA (uracil1498-N3)-methyltransferase